MIKIVLNKPVEIMGKPVSELEMDLDSVTGRDLMDALRYADDSGSPVGGAAYSMSAAAWIAAKACSINVPTLLELGASDFNDACSAAAPLLEGSD